MTQCVILAGGLATRMRPHTETVPKALLEVAGKPFADLQLSWLAAQGVRSVVYSIGYLGDQIRNYVGDGRRYGLDVVYVEEHEHLLGTGGALRLALEAEQLESAFFTLYGDSYLRVDIAAVAERFATTDCDALMTLLPVEAVPGERANARLVGSFVDIYDKAAPESLAQTLTHIDYGLGVFTDTTIEVGVPSGRVHDLAALQQLLAARHRLAAFEVTDRFYEIGSPEGLALLNDHLASA